MFVNIEKTTEENIMAAEKQTSTPIPSDTDKVYIHLPLRISNLTIRTLTKRSKLRNLKLI